MQVTNEEILRGLAEIVNEVAGVETSEITPEKSFVDELDIDSLSIKTVGDAVDYVAKTT